MKLLNLRDAIYTSPYSKDMTTDEINEIITDFFDRKVYKNSLSAKLFVDTEDSIEVKIVLFSDIQNLGIY